MCQILASNYFNTRHDRHELRIFFNNDLELSKLTLGQGHDSPSGYNLNMNKELPIFVHKIWTGHELCTDRRTDRDGLTDRRTGMVIPIYFSNFACGGIRFHIIYYVMFIKYI